VRKADNLTTILGHCYVIWEPLLCGTLWAPRACNGTDLAFFFTFKLEGVFVAKSLVKHPKLLYSLAPCSRQVLCCSLLIYVLTAIGLTPGDSSTVHIYAKRYIEQHS